MARFHVITDAVTGETTQVPFTPEEEAAFDAIASPVPPVISDRQFFQQLAVLGVITKQEAREAVKVGTIPAEMQAIVDSMADEDEQFAAEMLLCGATQFRRDHPMVGAFAAAKGWTSEQVDDLFRSAAAL